MKLFAIAVLAAALTASAGSNWNPFEADQEAMRDIRSGQFKFYWSGSIAVQPVGVPLDLARQYPRADAGVGCAVTDIKLRERQEEYARRYNQKILAYLKKK
jgi:hypothetical protein